MCPQITQQELIQSLIRLGKRDMLQLLQRFHCFLEEYAQEHGIFAAIQDTVRIWTQLLNKLHNWHIFKRRAQQPREYYETAIAQAESLAYNDILSAHTILHGINQELL